MKEVERDFFGLRKLTLSTFVQVLSVRFLCLPVAVFYRTTVLRALHRGYAFTKIKYDSVIFVFSHGIDQSNVSVCDGNGWSDTVRTIYIK